MADYLGLLWRGMSDEPQSRIGIVRGDERRDVLAVIPSAIYCLI